ncbi:DUF6641 family protein [Polynucleobacter sp. es-MAR-4]|jgi:hypothetical protein|uniref:DUF6641 family protein n=1 Tax=Polynucleobacter sp. es-MAR-4 TaxID=1855655 RepID=UPI001C0C5E58|nr:DUF6641 family protein [Polynucleobacter sp. es-MAR-4]MBU3636589.1 hypothetical protein [Polynucleobacter sp. es-MAR-4]
MATLASLKLVAAKKPTNQPPVLQRRNKLSSKVFEQIQLAKAQSEGGTYAPTKHKTVTNADGERVAVTVPKRIKPWWFVAENGKCCIAIRYGAKVIELAKGKTAIEVASPDALIEALEAVNSAVLAGELDAQIESVSGQLRSGFLK